MAQTSPEAEAAVRAYLESLLNPTYVSEEIQKLEAQLDNETDVIQIAVLKQAIADERQGTKLLDGFVTHGKTWADELGITAQTLYEMGVGQDALRRGGFNTAGLTGGTRSAPAPTQRKPRRASVSSEDIERSVRSHRKSSMLSVPDVMETTGASNATVRKTLDALVEQGVLAAPIDDPNHSGRGRAKKLYEKL